MSWADVLTVYHAHLVTAGATLTPQITTVVRGEPSAVPLQATIAYWWGGRRESRTGGNTLTRVNLEEALVTEIYAPPDTVRLTNVNQTIEDYLYAAVFAVHAELWGDAHLGENAIAIAGLTETSTGWMERGNSLARMASFTTWVDLAEVHVIAN